MYQKLLFLLFCYFINNSRAIDAMDIVCQDMPLSLSDMPCEIQHKIFSYITDSPSYLNNLHITNTKIYQNLKNFLDLTGIYKWGLLGNLKLDNIKQSFKDKAIDIAISSNGIYAAIVYNAEIEVWDLNKSEILYIINLKRSNKLFCFNESFKDKTGFTQIYKNRYLISRLYNNIIGVWDIYTGTLIKKIYAPDSVISIDKVHIYNNNIVILFYYNLKSKEQKFFMFNDYDKLINSHDISIGETVYQYEATLNNIMMVTSRGICLKNLRTLEETLLSHPNNYNFLHLHPLIGLGKHAISEDSTYIISAYDKLPKLIRNLKQNTEIEFNSDLFIKHIKISHNNHFFITISYINNFSVIRLYDIVTGNMINQFEIESLRIENLILTPDNKILIFNSNNKIYFFDLQKCKIIKEYKNDFKNLKVSDDGTVIACLSGFWNVLPNKSISINCKSIFKRLLNNGILEKSSYSIFELIELINYAEKKSYNIATSDIKHKQYCQILRNLYIALTYNLALISRNNITLESYCSIISSLTKETKSNILTLFTKIPTEYRVRNYQKLLSLLTRNKRTYSNITPELSTH